MVDTGLIVTPKAEETLRQKSINHGSPWQTHTQEGASIETGLGMNKSTWN